MERGVSLKNSNSKLGSKALLTLVMTFVVDIIIDYLHVIMLQMTLSPSCNGKTSTFYEHILLIISIVSGEKSMLYLKKLLQNIIDVGPGLVFLCILVHSICFKSARLSSKLFLSCRPILSLSQGFK